MTRAIRPGDIVRHRGTGLYPEFAGQYGLVQSKDAEGDLILGVEWDKIPQRWTSSVVNSCRRRGHSLTGILHGSRARSGWYVSPQDVTVL